MRLPGEVGRRPTLASAAATPGPGATNEQLRDAAALAVGMWPRFAGLLIGAAN